MKYEEAIKLKPGTPILIRSKVIAVTSTGDIVYGTHAHEQEYEAMYAKTDCRYADIQIPEQNLDIFRLFRKGDIVTPRRVNGRTFSKQLTPLTGEKCIVGRDEIIGDWIVIYHDNKRHYIDAAYLTLITPVEELDTYIVVENSLNNSYEVRCCKSEHVCAAYYYSHDQATYDVSKAFEAAKAECDRLNAEWRKKQKGTTHIPN